MRQANKATVDARELEGLDEILKQMPSLLLATGGPLDRAVAKGGTVVAKRARQLAPDSRKTGTRDKQSKKARETWDTRLRTTIKTKNIKYDTASISIVGPKAPEGNAAHFMQEKPRRLVLWGKSTLIKMYRIARDWIAQAFDETKSEQQSAMEASLRADLDKVMRGGN